MSAQTEPYRYSMIIEWEPNDGIYVVTVPELPGCRTHGSTYEEAVQQGQEVIEGWIDAQRHWGHEIPPPRFYDLGDWQPEPEQKSEPEPAMARTGD